MNPPITSCHLQTQLPHLPTLPTQIFGVNHILLSMNQASSPSASFFPFTDSNVLHDRLPRGHEHSSACCELVELGEPDLSPGSHGGHDVLEAKLRSGPEGL